MKKYFTILVGILLLTLMVGGVAGVEATNVAYKDITNPETSKTTTVYLTLTQSYVVHIPESVTLNDQDVVTGYSLSVSDLIIPSSKKLAVDVSSTNSWKVVLKDNPEVQDHREIAYDMDYAGYLSGTCDSNSGTNPIRVLEARMNTVNTPVALTFDLIGDIHHMGNYEDTLTFTVSLPSLS